MIKPGQIKANRRDCLRFILKVKVMPCFRNTNSRVVGLLSVGTILQGYQACKYWQVLQEGAV